MRDRHLEQATMRAAGHKRQHWQAEAMRPLSDVESAIIRRLLQPDFPGVAELRVQAEQVLGVELDCACGCPSIRLTIGRDRADPAPVDASILPVSLIELERAGGIPREVIAFTDGDRFLTSLECIYFDEAIDEWPDPDDCALYLGSSPRGVASITLPSGVTLVPAAVDDAWLSTHFEGQTFVGATLSGWKEIYDQHGSLLSRTSIS